MNVELRIEELVLHGFVPGDRHRIGDAVERELSRLMVEHGVPPSLAPGEPITHLEGGALEVTSGLRAEAVGERVAQQLYNRMTKA